MGRFLLSMGGPIGIDNNTDNYETHDQSLARSRTAHRVKKNYAIGQLRPPMPHSDHKWFLNDQIRGFLKTPNSW